MTGPECRGSNRLLIKWAERLESNYFETLDQDLVSLSEDYCILICRRKTETISFCSVFLLSSVKIISFVYAKAL